MTKTDQVLLTQTPVISTKTNKLLVLVLKEILHMCLSSYEGRGLCSSEFYLAGSMGAAGIM